MAKRPQDDFLDHFKQFRNYQRIFIGLSAQLTARRLSKKEQARYDELRAFFEQLTSRRDAETKRLLSLAKKFIDTVL
jgi:hypothetical protein